MAQAQSSNTFFSDEDYLRRGDARRKKGDLDGAIADFTQAITIKPNHTRALEAQKVAELAARKVQAEREAAATRAREEQEDAAKREQLAREAQWREMQNETTKFRLGLKVEAETNCGPVIEIKGGLVKVYFPVANYGNEHWVQKSRLFPPGYGCRFVNGRYQPPYDF